MGTRSSRSCAQGCQRGQAVKAPTQRKTNGGAQAKISQVIKTGAQAQPRQRPGGKTGQLPRTLICSSQVLKASARGRGLPGDISLVSAKAPGQKTLKNFRSTRPRNRMLIHLAGNGSPPILADTSVEIAKAPGLSTCTSWGMEAQPLQLPVNHYPVSPWALGSMHG